MKIDVICSDPNHPVHAALLEWAQRKIIEGHACRVINNAAEIDSGDLLFLVSCSQIVPADVRNRFGATLVLHASDLPNGRGWSPHIWEILKGNNQITLSLLEASDRVDTGDIWAKKTIAYQGHELLPEINALLFKEELNLMDFAIKNFGKVKKKKQVELIEQTYRKRTQADSQLDPDKTIAEQFNLLRVVDNSRYPAFFDLNGFRYKITIEKMR